MKASPGSVSGAGTAGASAGGILCLLAHPDDESFLVAGVACRYGALGVPTAVVTATGGEAGKRGDPPICTREELPAVRKAELLEATRLLGIRELLMLGYRDRALSEAPPEQVRGALVAGVRRWRPRLVITFDPNGGNLHPDHVAISRFASDALAAAADPRWLPEAGPAHQVERLLWTSPVMPWEAGRHADLAAAAGVDFAVDIRPWAGVKEAALRAHRSQHISIDRLFLKQPDLSRLLELEIFRQAWGPPFGGRPCADLWSGLR